MKKVLICAAILAVSTTGAFAKHKAHHAAKPKAAAASSASIPGYQLSAADKKMYMKNKHDAGMK